MSFTYVFYLASFFWYFHIDSYPDARPVTRSRLVKLIRFTAVTAPCWWSLSPTSTAAGASADPPREPQWQPQPRRQRNNANQPPGSERSDRDCGLHSTAMAPRVLCLALRRRILRRENDIHEVMEILISRHRFAGFLFCNPVPLSCVRYCTGGASRILRARLHYSISKQWKSRVRDARAALLAEALMIGTGLTKALSGNVRAPMPGPVDSRLYLSFCTSNNYPPSWCFPPRNRVEPLARCRCQKTHLQ